MAFLLQNVFKGEAILYLFVVINCLVTRFDQRMHLLFALNSVISSNIFHVVIRMFCYFTCAE